MVKRFGFFFGLVRGVLVFIRVSGFFGDEFDV